MPTSGGALIGLGIGVKSIDRVIGVAKAFTGRVSSGPFPCEIIENMANKLRGTGENPWDEFGTATDRPRRVGWLDLVMLNHANRINDFSCLTANRLDILSGIVEISVCTPYRQMVNKSKVSLLSSPSWALMSLCTKSCLAGIRIYPVQSVSTIFQ